MNLRTYSKNRGAKLLNGRWHSPLRGTPLYDSWRAMKKRCLCPNHDAYHNYGGRNIKICEALLESPITIRDVIGNRPRNKTLDRINNEGHYTCGSCTQCIEYGWPLNIKWSTYQQQARNSRMNRIVEINGEKHPACEWADKLGLPRHVFYQRLDRGETGELLTGGLRRIRKQK